jgi:hypothetical protein
VDLIAIVRRICDEAGRVYIAVNRFHCAPPLNAGVELDEHPFRILRGSGCFSYKVTDALARIGCVDAIELAV